MQGAITPGGHAHQGGPADPARPGAGRASARARPRLSVGADIVRHVGGRDQLEGHIDGAVHGFSAGEGQRGIEAAGTLEMVPWIPPLAVRLERASQEPPAFANATLEAPAQAANASAAPGGQSINADQAIQLLRQLEALKHAR